MDQIQEILNRINIVDIIGQHVRLTKRGNSYVGLCPFHNEKTPSFYVSPEKGVYYCFGCQASGNIFTFMEQYEKIPFKDAISILADRLGIKLQKKDKKTKDKENNIINILQALQQIFVEEFKKSDIAQKYIKSRNFTDQTINDFGIGYAPNDKNYQYKKLLSLGFDHIDILNAGVIKLSEKNPNDFYDRFRHRIIIPIYNASGIVVGFSGRAIDDNDQPKYLNSPENEIFKKSSLLFNLNNAKEYIKEKNEVIVMEGYMDVMKAYQAGTKNVVASMGTAFTQTQMAILKRYCNTIVFCFDNDTAGTNATYKSISYAQKEDMDIKIIKLDDYKDPDECIDKDINKWYNVLQNKIDLMEFLFTKVQNDYDTKSIIGKTKITDIILPFIKNYTNIITQDYYIKKLSNLCDISIDVLKKKLDTIELDFLQDENNNIKIDGDIIGLKDKELYLIALILNHIDIFKTLDNKPDSQIFSNKIYKDLYEKIINNDINYIDIENTLDEVYKNELRKMIFLSNEISMYYNMEKLIEEINKIAYYIKQDNKKRRLNNIIKQMKQISDKKSEAYIILLKQYNELLYEK